MRGALFVVASLCLSACGGEVQNEPAVSDGSADTVVDEVEPVDSVAAAIESLTEEESSALIGTLRADAAAILERPEHDSKYVVVRHLLVSFQPVVPGASRTRDEALIKAAELWRRVKDGADFEGLVRRHTNDRFPGIYDMADHGVPGGGSMARSTMAKSFGDVAWRLEPGEFGVAYYHKKRSKFGWHIIQRIE